MATLAAFLTAPEPFTLHYTCLLMLSQLLLASNITHWWSFSFWLQSLTIGCVLSHQLFRMCEEFALNRCFGQTKHDRWGGRLANLATGVPYAEPLRETETAHLAGRQNDVFERRLPLQWVQALCYPSAIARSLPWRSSDASDIAIQVGFNLAWGLMYGWSSLLYLLVSTYTSFCPLHPIANYLLHRHEPKQTNKYRGLLLLPTCHPEQHRHPRVPWTRIAFANSLPAFPFSPCGSGSS